MDRRRSRRALLISSIHEPIAFVGYRRTYSLLRREVVDVLSEWDEQIVPDVNMPAILRLKNFVLSRTSHKMCSFSRGVVFARDGYRCQYCGKHLAFRDSTIDHVVPRSRGGKNHWTNCVTSCKHCNRRKDRMTPEEAGMTLLHRPSVPSVTHFWMADVQRIPSGEEWHPHWDDYVTT